MKYYIIVIAAAVLVIVYLIVKKENKIEVKTEENEASSVNNQSNVEPKPEPKPVKTLNLPSVVVSSQTIDLKREFDKSLKFNPVKINVSIDYYKNIKVFLYCYKTGLIRNKSIFKESVAYMPYAQYFELVRKNEEVTYNPILDIYEEFYKIKELDKQLWNRKFKPGYYDNKKEHDLVFGQMFTYIDRQYELVEDNEFVSKLVTWNKLNFPLTYVDHIITDNIALNYLILEQCFKKKFIRCATIISNKINKAPKEFKVLRYKFFKQKKNENFLEKAMSFISDLLPDDVMDFLKKYKAEIIVSSLSMNFISGLLVYAGKKVMGEDNFNSIMATLYGIGVSIVSGLFLGPEVAPLGYKLGKAEARLILEDDPDVASIAKGIISLDEFKNYLLGSSDESMEDYDSIAFTDAEVINE